MAAPGHAIVLIGFMGTGKSSAARELARHTGRKRFDTDAMVIQQLGRGIPEIFSQLGEGAFREVETAALRQISPHEETIVVTGGGIVTRAENRALIQALGRVVNLTADEETIFARVSRRANRPLLKTADPRRTISELLRERRELYASIADVTVDTSRLTHSQVVDEILRVLDVPRALSVTPGK